MPTSTIPKTFGVWFSNLEAWARPIKIVSAETLPKDWKVATVDQIVMQVLDKVLVDPSKEYKMAGIRWYGEGVFHRETVLGKDISSKYVIPCVRNALIYNRLFAWKESFAVVSDDFVDCYVSSEFPQFIVDQCQAIPNYLYLLFTTETVINAVKSSSIGSSAVSRNRFKEETLRSFEIPLPPLPIQQKIVDYWQQENARLHTIRTETEKLRKEKYNELLKYFKLHLMKPTPRKGAFAIDWANVYRLDTFFYRKDFCELEKQLNNTQFEELGNILNFLSRPWSKKDFTEGTFEYIEISSVDKEYGITSTKTVNIKNAPSRATTLVKKGDIILSTTRPYLGAFAIVSDSYDNCVCSSGFALADSLKSKQVDKEYLIYFLKSDAGLRQMERYMTGGLYPAIVQGELENIKVPVPDLKKQKNFVRKLKEEETRQNLKYKQACINFVKVKRNIESIILGQKKIGEI